jgi:hypothetical protein
VRVVGLRYNPLMAAIASVNPTRASSNQNRANDGPGYPERVRFSRVPIVIFLPLCVDCASVGRGVRNV